MFIIIHSFISTNTVSNKNVYDAWDNAICKMLNYYRDGKMFNRHHAINRSQTT